MEHLTYSGISPSAPERGPDFWRILGDDPYRNQTNVTLVLEVKTNLNLTLVTILVIEEQN